jgi:hypothetical protein
MALKKKYGGLPSLYTDIAVTVRSARSDGTAVPLYIHYKTTGDVDVRFWIGGASFMIPLSVMLKVCIISGQTNPTKGTCGYH